MRHIEVNVQEYFFIFGACSRTKASRAEMYGERGLLDEDG
jgi:hypothetical protein